MDIQPAQHDRFAIYIRIGGYTAGWTDEFGGFKQLMYNMHGGILRSHETWDNDYSKEPQDDA